eukprot:Nk52_evm3s313 gene=Nk52_evmTU3s313
MVFLSVGFIVRQWLGGGGVGGRGKEEEELSRVHVQVHEIPVVCNTWAFTCGTKAGYEVVSGGLEEGEGRGSGVYRFEVREGEMRQGAVPKGCSSGGGVEIEGMGRVVEVVEVKKSEGDHEQEGVEEEKEKRVCLDAVVAGCSVCEAAMCDGTVGPGGGPDEEGEVRLDAMVMEGHGGRRVGGVGSMGGVRWGVQVAREVLRRTRHSLLVGDNAERFAQRVGFGGGEDLNTEWSRRLHREWVEKGRVTDCWRQKPETERKKKEKKKKERKEEERKEEEGKEEEGKEGVSVVQVSPDNHDTVGMVCVSAPSAFISCAASTNGLAHKIPGRVGDTPIPGAGCYAAPWAGCACTGDGDVMVRHLPAYQVVETVRVRQEEMKKEDGGHQSGGGDGGEDVYMIRYKKICMEAAVDALTRIARAEKEQFCGGLVLAVPVPPHSSSCSPSLCMVVGVGYGWDFPYTVCSPSTHGHSLVHMGYRIPDHFV